MNLILDASGNPVTQVVISVTDASGNSVTGESSFIKLFNSTHINWISVFKILASFYFWSLQKNIVSTVFHN